MNKLERRQILRKFIEDNIAIRENRKLAKLLHSKYPALWPDIEIARRSIRGQLALTGDRERKVNQAFANHIAELRKMIPIEVEQEMDLTPYDLPKRFKKPLIIGDLHYPYTDLEAVDVSLEYGYVNGVDSIIINGDFCDFKTIAKYLSKPNSMRTLETVAGAKNLLEYIKKSLGVKVVFHEGNHDVRFEHYLIRNAPELWGMPGTTLKEQLGCAKLNIDYVENERYMNVGNLAVTHGNHIVKGIFAPVNAARGAFNKALTSVLINHVHKTSSHTEPNLHRRVTGTFSVGCLTTVTPEYNPQTGKFNQGFAIVTRDPDGAFEVDNKRIIDGKAR